MSRMNCARRWHGCRSRSAWRAVPTPICEQEFDRIEQEAARLEELIGGDTVALAAGRSGARAGQLEPVNLGELLETLATMPASRRIRAASACGSIRVPPLEVEGDRELLFRALENVLRNAVRFSPDGGMVALTVLRAADQALLRIRDHGPGVPQESLERIFEPFVSASPGAQPRIRRPRHRPCHHRARGGAASR